MTPIRFLAAATLLVAATSLAGCGGSKAKAEPAPAPAATAAPTYPSCAADGDCASHGEVCVDGSCKQCRDHGQCASMGPCGKCENNACVKMEGCCATDAECNGGRCRAGKCH
jgi:peptidoglycan-associated lipoprotein